MTTTTMKQKLQERFSSFAISQCVWLHTQRTTDIDDITDVELEKIFNLFFPKQPTAAEQVFTLKNEELKKRKRSNCLTIATRIGIKETDCWLKFNNWMLKSSVHKKALKEYNLQELEALERQLRSAESNYNKSAEKTGTKAWYHKNKLIQPSQN